MGNEVLNTLATLTILLPWLAVVVGMRKLPFGDLAALMFGLPSGLMVAFIIWRIWA